MMELKITEAKVYRVKIPGDIWVLISIETNQGLTGWGEVSGNRNDAGVAALVRDFSKQSCGKDALTILELTRSFCQWGYPDLRENRIFSATLSGIDQALWDLQAQALKVPLYQLLGGYGNREIPLYANLNKALWGNRTPEALQEAGEKAYQEGFSFVKCTPFDEVRPDWQEADLVPGLERYRALLQRVPCDRVAVDCHKRFDRRHFSLMMDAITGEYGTPYWVEDPLFTRNKDDFDEIRRRYPQLRLAGGEDHIGYSQCLDMINNKSHDIFMPDLKYIGGVSVARTLIAVCDGMQQTISLHNPNGPVSAAHSAHVSAVSRKVFPIEFPFGTSPVRQQALTAPEPVSHGCYFLSDRPGIGLAPRADFLKEYGEIL